MWYFIIISHDSRRVQPERDREADTHEERWVIMVSREVLLAQQQQPVWNTIRFSSSAQRGGDDDEGTQ